MGQTRSSEYVQSFVIVQDVKVRIRKLQGKGYVNFWVNGPTNRDLLEVVQGSKNWRRVISCYRMLKVTGSKRMPEVCGEILGGLLVCL